MSFDEKIRSQVHYIENVIAKFLPEEEGYQKTVFEAMNYAVNAGGKRIRPMLMSQCAQLFGGANDRLLEPFMAAIEMIHTYSLIHDDLPALDNDDYRRGRKTVHIVYGEAMAILAGDALLNYAYEVASKALLLADPQELSRASQAMAILAKKPGIYGMIGGQVVDVERTGQSLNLDELTFIYKNKTSALIECAMTIGAVLAGADEQQVKMIDEAAEKIGIAFQIQDDILDITGSTEELGKPVGSDEKNDKITYAKLEGLEAAGKQVSCLSMEALEILEKMGLSQQNPFLKELILWMIHREK